MNRKITLDPDALQVESFEVEIAARERGTVHAHDAASGVSCTYACTVGEFTCNGPQCNTVPVLTCRVC
jgi:hypothetical protein